MANKRMEKIAAVEKNIEEVKELKEKASGKKWNPEDLIPCRSMVSGQLFVKGDRSGYEYNWADYGDVTDIEYRDLIYMVKSSGNLAIYSPRIIVEDDDFISQNPKLQTLYDSLYSQGDLIDILNLPAGRMAKEIESLPDGAKDTIKHLAATLIEEGRLDSVQKIKEIDKIFDTQLLLTLAQN